jgi:hypothetical protein
MLPKNIPETIEQELEQNLNGIRFVFEMSDIAIKKEIINHIRTIGLSFYNINYYIITKNEENKK